MRSLIEGLVCVIIGAIIPLFEPLEDPVEYLCVWLFFSLFTDEVLALVVEKRSKSVSSLLTSLATS